MTTRALQGKTALITGAGQRLGRASALALAADGANIVIHYRRSVEEARQLQHAVEDLGVRAWTVQADLAEAAGYESLIDHALEVAGFLDILVNNASIFPTDRLGDITLDSVVSNLEINAWAPFILSREFARQVKKGTIINMLDSRLTGYDWTHVSYYLSKQMLAVLTRMTALQFAPDITVNAVAPGLVLPPPGGDESYLTERIGTVPLKRHGEATDVAQAVLFLARSAFITGQVIFVDGGRHLLEYSSGSNPH
ncbi:MAG: SDR family oxidoreductase [Armatimonadota bacterium]